MNRDNMCRVPTSDSHGGGNKTDGRMAIKTYRIPEKPFALIPGKPRASMAMDFSWARQGLAGLDYLMIPAGSGEHLAEARARVNLLVL